MYWKLKDLKSNTKLAAKKKGDETKDTGEHSNLPSRLRPGRSHVGLADALGDLESGEITAE